MAMRELLRIFGTLPYFVSYPWHSFGWGIYNPSAEMQLLYLQPQPTGQQDTRLGEGLTPLPRCSRCILPPQPIGPQNSRLGRDLPFWRDAVGVFYSHRRMSHSTHVWGVFLPLWIGTIGVFSSHSWLGHRALVWGRGLTPLKRRSWCILQPQPIGPQCSRWGTLTSLQGCSRCILQPQSNGPVEGLVDAFLLWT